MGVKLLPVITITCGLYMYSCAIGHNCGLLRVQWLLGAVVGLMHGKQAQHSAWFKYTSKADLADFSVLPPLKPGGGGGGGVLSGKVGRGCAAQIGCFFGLSGFAMAPFLFENWFWYRSRFCKMHNFRWIFPLVYLQVVKKYLCIPIYIVKSTDWF